jgi:hypothetical protein
VEKGSLTGATAGIFSLSAFAIIAQTERTSCAHRPEEIIFRDFSNHRTTDATVMAYQGDHPLDKRGPAILLVKLHRRIIPLQKLHILRCSFALEEIQKDNFLLL